MYKKALLLSQNGDEFIGWTTESFKPATGELIFNTAMTGFVEILSDPSYINQIVTFTSSHVGNYGMSKNDFESNKPKIEAAIGHTFTDSHVGNDGMSHYDFESNKSKIEEAIGNNCTESQS